MTNVPFGNSARDTAILLLAAAQELYLGPEVVEARPFKNVFVVPDEVAKRAGFGDEPTETPPAKKAPAKKATAAKKTAAKKTSAKKASAKKEGSK